MQISSQDSITTLNTEKPKNTLTLITYELETNTKIDTSEVFQVKQLEFLPVTCKEIKKETERCNIQARRLVTPAQRLLSNVSPTIPHDILE